MTEGDLSSPIATRPGRKRPLTLVRVVAGVAGLLVVGWAVGVTAVELGQRSRPSLPLLAAAVVITGVGTLCGGLGWAGLFRRRGKLSLTRGYVASQLAKYLPGGIWQPAGQLAMARTAGVPTAEASTALLVFYAACVVVASAGGPVLAIGLDALHPLLRLGAALLPLSVLALHPAVLVRLLRLLPWNRRRADLLLPGVARLWRVMAGHLGYLLAHGAALAMVLTWLGVDHVGVVVVAAFAVSWAAGFLAVPAPAGAGVREVVLVALLASWANAQEVVAAAVVVRLAALASEVLLTITLLGVERLAGRGKNAVRGAHGPVTAELAAEQAER